MKNKQCDTFSLILIKLK